MFSLHSSLFAVEIRVNFIKADTAQNFGVLMAQAVPWYYKLYWKMEGWLASKAHKSSDSDRGFFGRMLSDAGNRNKNVSERLKSTSAAVSKAFSHQKPMHDSINFSLPAGKEPGTKEVKNAA